MPGKNEYRCFACKQRFESLGDMQRHIVIDHLQKADFIKKIGGNSSSSSSSNKKGEVKAA